MSTKSILIYSDKFQYVKWLTAAPLIWCCGSLFRLVAGESPRPTIKEYLYFSVKNTKQMLAVIGSLLTSWAGGAAHGRNARRCADPWR